MGRLIDAEELTMRVLTTTRTESNERMLDLLTGLIADAPTACEWHCVADEKPEEIGSTLHRDKHDPILLYAEKSHAFYVGWYVGKDWRGVDEFINRTSLNSWQYITRKITHWMPLPKPPERSSQ